MFFVYGHGLLYGNTSILIFMFNGSNEREIISLCYVIQCFRKDPCIFGRDICKVYYMRGSVRKDLLKHPREAVPINL